ncbi:MAG: MOSC and FAD-binding oxidoreductase domain-containing protein [Acidobacteriaceae bacterium]
MNSVVSVNVGLPRDVEWQGKIVHTGVWKKPVAGRVMARRLNLDGDGQGDLGGHGGVNRAVMVYQLDSYRYWEKQLQRKDLEYGNFGENLTVEGLPDDEVCIGDRYRIGGALFEVSQPRVTCYRVGIRMANPQMPSLLVSHKRPGFYLRVIEEGEIGPGDEIVKVADGPEHVTVAEMDGLLYLPGHPREALQRALRISSLSAGWRGSLQALLTGGEKQGNAGLAPVVSPPAWRGFRSLEVTVIQQECVGVRSFVFASEDRSALPPPLPGQFLVFKLDLDPPLTRSYSLSGPQDAGTYRVSVKRAEGAGSHFFHDSLKVGDRLQVSAPRGSFTLSAGEGQVVLLSAGIGATPVLAMLHSLASAGAARDVWWCYGARNGKEHPFALETRQILGKLPRSHSLIAYSQPDDSDEQGKNYDVHGHLSVSMLQKLEITQTADFYLCGPPAFLSRMMADLQSWEVPYARVHSEVFGTEAPMTPGIAAATPKAPHSPAGNPGSGPTVSFTRSGLTVPWDARFSTLLDFAEACDVPVRWACRAGVCHNCESGLIAGDVRYSLQPLDPPADGNVLLCCSSPQSAIELDL